MLASYFTIILRIREQPLPDSRTAALLLSAHLILLPAPISHIIFTPDCSDRLHTPPYLALVRRRLRLHLLAVPSAFVFHILRGRLRAAPQSLRVISSPKSCAPRRCNAANPRSSQRRQIADPGTMEVNTIAGASQAAAEDQVKTTKQTIASILHNRPSDVLLTS